MQVVSDSGLMTVFQRRANDDYWKTLNYIQTNVKAQIGCGTPIIVRFFAPIDENKTEATIDYNYQEFGEDEDLLRNGMEEAYCLKQVYRMCFYIQKLYDVEILRMRADFAKDHNGTIWFKYCNDISTRPNMNAEKVVEESKARVTVINQELRQKYMDDMTQHDKETDPALRNSLLDIMSTQYQGMRKHAGFDGPVRSENTEDLETKAAFKALRPNAKHELADVLTGKVKEARPKLF